MGAPRLISGCAAGQASNGLRTGLLCTATMVTVSVLPAMPVLCEPAVRGSHMLAVGSKALCVYTYACTQVGQALQAGSLLQAMRLRLLCAASMLGSLFAAGYAIKRAMLGFAPTAGYAIWLARLAGYARLRFYCRLCNQACYAGRLG